LKDNQTISGRGGKRPGAGRPKGSPNKRTAEQVEAIASTGMTPLQYLTSVFQDVSADEARRIDAAKAAAPYCHAKLQPVDSDGDTTQKVSATGALVWQPPQ
jgi:hypothetical protein